jgi:hypothetical protein
MRRVEAGHDHAPLPPPGLAIGAEDPAQQAQLVPDLFEPAGAPEAIGPVAQRSGNRLWSDTTTSRREPSLSR